MQIEAIVVGIAIALVAVLLLRWFGARGRSRTARTRGRIAVEGEQHGAALLADAGFRIVGRQVAHELAIEVDGETYGARLRCDYLVAKDGETWVAEIKTGEDAPSLTNPATRRQLLEYQVAYAVAGVVLVDATAGTVHEVRFRLGDQQAAASA